MIYSRLFSIKLYLFYDSGHEFDKLIQVDSSFFVFLFNDYFILTLYFNVRFIRK